MTVINPSGACVIIKPDPTPLGGANKPIQITLLDGSTMWAYEKNAATIKALEAIVTAQLNYSKEPATMQALLDKGINTLPETSILVGGNYEKSIKFNELIEYIKTNNDGYSIIYAQRAYLWAIEMYALSPYGILESPTFNDITQIGMAMLTNYLMALVDQALSQWLSDITRLLKTEPNKAYFWSGTTSGVGGADRALEIAKMNGGTTLEGLIQSKGINMPQWDINNPASIKAWEDVSAAYANQVSGEVRAVVGANLRPGNIWENVELPKLISNPNVTKIIMIDPRTLAETVIFTR